MQAQQQRLPPYPPDRFETETSQIGGEQPRTVLIVTHVWRRPSSVTQGPRSSRQFPQKTLSIVKLDSPDGKLVGACQSGAVLACSGRPARACPRPAISVPSMVNARHSEDPDPRRERAPHRRTRAPPGAPTSARGSWNMSTSRIWARPNPSPRTNGTSVIVELLAKGVLTAHPVQADHKPMPSVSVRVGWTDG